MQKMSHSLHVWFFEIYERAAYRKTNRHTGMLVARNTSQRAGDEVAKKRNVNSRLNLYGQHCAYSVTVLAGEVNAIGRVRP